jgi:hypothetical protein
LDTSTGSIDFSVKQQQQQQQQQDDTNYGPCYDRGASGQQLSTSLPPPPLMENAFHVSVAPVSQLQNGVPPADVVLIVSIGPILFRNHPIHSRLNPLNNAFVKVSALPPKIGSRRPPFVPLKARPPTE